VVKPMAKPMVKLFVEGGGDSDALKTECRQAFTKLLERAGLKGRMPRVVACGARRSAFEQFCTALEGAGKGDLAILLVDAESAVTHGSPWDHVATREGDKWVRPKGATDEQLHLMVECMESWFLADPRALAVFYGGGFHASKLPTGKPESVSKADLYHKLAEATKDTKTKGSYGKGTHSFKLLATLDPSLVAAACPWAAKFFESLRELL